MRVKNRKMHVHDSGFLRYFCVEMHLLSLSRHFFCAKAQCPGCHGASVVTRLTVFFNGDIYSLGIVIVSFIMNLNVSDFLLCLTMLLIDLLIKLVFLLILSLGSNLSSHLSLIPND